MGDTSQAETYEEKRLHTDRKDQPSLKLDPCDLLLDAIDAQLGQLQVQHHKLTAASKEHGDPAPSRWSHSLDKDTGFGSTSQMNDSPMSCLDLIRTPTVDRTSDRDARSPPDCVTLKETKQTWDHRSSHEVEMESRREQVIWRLERLLGDTSKEERMAGEVQPLSDSSVCTEDFVRRFTEEMVKLPLTEGGMQGLEEETEGTEGTTVADSGTAGNGTKHQRHEAESCRSDSETEGAGRRRTASRHVGDESCNEDDASSPSAPFRWVRFSPPVCYSSEDTSKHENPKHKNVCSPQARRLAGVPVWSFDNVSIDSELDSVCTEQVRKHLHMQPGWRSLLQPLRTMSEFGTDPSGCDTLTVTGSEDQTTPVQRSTQKNGQKRTTPPTSEAQHHRRERETFRPVSSLDEDDEDTDEEMKDRSRRRSTEGASDWGTMKKRLSTLRQKCEREEETLRLKKTHLTEVELSIAELQLRRKHALQDLERLTAESSHMEREKRDVECALRERKAERDSVSCQLQELQRQRESCVLEGRGVHTAQQNTMQTNVVMSALEREEMERQLVSAKTELIHERRRTRERLDSMQEKLEETLEELQRVSDAENSLRNRSSSLEKKQRQTEVEQHWRARELQEEVGQCRLRVGALEEMLAQKEIQLQEVQEQRSISRAERDALSVELQRLRSQHSNDLKDTREQAHAAMEAALNEQRKTDLVSAHAQQIQKLKEQEEKMKDESTRREEELHEALDKVRKSLEEERRKWEVEKMDCGILEEQNRRSLEHTRGELQREKSRALTLQHQVVELQRRAQALESERCVQQREHEALISVICKSLKEEHREELERFHQHVAQESQRTALRHEQAVQTAKKEADRLRGAMEEKEIGHEDAANKQEQQLRHWAGELRAECEHLRLLLEQTGGQRPGQLPPSPTMDEALTNLKTLREQLRAAIDRLLQELRSLEQTREQLRKEKERDLSLQKQQLRMERDQALGSLQERLIQEHIEELSSLKRAHVCDGGGGGRGLEASLRKQLEAKDTELRRVQKSMSQWKERTAARLACKFGEELTAELERKTSRTREETQDNQESCEGPLTFAAKEETNSVFCPFPSAASSRGPSDVASLKLLCYLQSRVKQLRVENQTCTWSRSHLSGSCLTTVTRPDSTEGLSSINTVPG